MKRFLLILLPLLLIWSLAGLALYKHYTARSEARIEKSASAVLPNFDPNAVTEISLNWRGIRTDLKRKENGQWTVQQKNHLADPNRIALLLDDLKKMIPLKLLTPVDKNLLKRLRLDPAEQDPKEIPGLRLTLKNGNSVLYDLMLGRGHFIAENNISLAVSKNTPDGRYLGRIYADGKVQPFLTGSVFENIHPMPGLWIKMPEICNPKAALQIRFISKKSQSWCIARRSVRAPFIAVQPKGSIADNQAIAALINTLSSPFAADCLKIKDCKFRLETTGAIQLLAAKAKTTIVFAVRTDKPGMIYAKFNNDNDFLYSIPAQIMERLEKAPLQSPKPMR